jgi:hypothetical protein
MTVSKMKARFANLTAYLGRDAHGQSLAKELKDSYNDVRKELAAARAACEKAEGSANAMREQLLKAQEECVTLERAKLHLADECRSLRQQLQLSETAAVREREKQVVAGRDETQTPRSVIKKIRKTIPVLPRIKQGHMFSGEWCGEWSKQQLCNDWSYKSMWTLGAAVALLSQLHGRVCISSEIRFRDEVPRNSDPDSDSTARHLVQWTAKSIGGEDSPARVISDRTTM